MKQRYLEVTFRNGKAIAAYLYLPRKAGDVSERTEKREGGLLIDMKGIQINGNWRDGAARVPSASGH